MRQILVSLLVIFITNQQVAAQLPISFSDIKSLAMFGYNLFQAGNAIENPDNTKQNVVQLLADVEKLSSDLHALSTHMDIKLDVMLKTLLSDFKIQSDLQEPKQKLSYYLNIVDRFYMDSMKYRYSESFSNKTLEKFADTVMWGVESLPSTLNNIHHLIDPGRSGHIVPGFTTLMLQATTQNLPTDCNKFVSAHQRIYYILAEIIVAELYGLAAQMQVLTTLRLIDEHGYNYNKEFKQFRLKFQTRLENYYEIFTRDMACMPRIIRRCDEKLSERGINFLEFQNFSRSAIIDASVLVGGPDYCDLTCPRNTKLLAYSIGFRTKTIIYDCEYLHSNIDICPPEPGSSRRYAWWKTGNGVVRGHQSVNKECDGEMYRFATSGKVSSLSVADCGSCVCSVDLNRSIKDDSDAVFRISITDQISNMENNMVVTGVQFVIYENALHLQIKHAAFMNGAMISKDAEWKPLYHQYNIGSLHPKKVGLNYASLQHDRKSLYLDDIEVPDNYAITGVRFAHVDNSGFMLQVHATPFTLETGELDLQRGQWFDATTHPRRPQDYKRNRLEITMKEADDPTRGTTFEYDEESNKFIKITHTDGLKDAGQTTIPYIDAQPLETIPLFPLNAIGIFYRGSAGYSGYIAPRLYTYNVTQNLQSSLNQWKETNEMYQRCGLSTPINITKFKESPDCAELKRIAAQDLGSADVTSATVKKP